MVSFFDPHRHCARVSRILKATVIDLVVQTLVKYNCVRLQRRIRIFLLDSLPFLVRCRCTGSTLGSPFQLKKIVENAISQDTERG